VGGGLRLASGRVRRGHLHVRSQRKQHFEEAAQTGALSSTKPHLASSIKALVKFGPRATWKPNLCHVVFTSEPGQTAPRIIDGSTNHLLRECASWRTSTLICNKTWRHRLKTCQKRSTPLLCAHATSPTVGLRATHQCTTSDVQRKHMRDVV
jgi:hypothetical protein